MSPRWLLLAHQLPTRPSKARVKTWRRLQQLGAVAARNSVYVLPNTEACREDFEWLRSEIVALGGEATVFAADTLGGDESEDIVATFRRTREADYRTLKREADRLRSSAHGRPAARTSGRDAWNRAVRGLRERFVQIERIDFFNAGGRREAAEALTAVEQAADRDKPTLRHDKATTLSTLPTAGFVNRRWVTRPRPGVDRMASAWLIRRFVDPRATFAFTDTPTESDVRFDMYAGEFSHRGALCTFEVMSERFGISVAVVTRISQIVHDLDMKETKYAPPEAPAIARMIEGLRMLHADDSTLLERCIEMFEALARSFESTEGIPRAASKPSPKRRSRRRRS